MDGADLLNMYEWFFCRCFRKPMFDASIAKVKHSFHLIRWELHFRHSFFTARARRTNRFLLSTFLVLHHSQHRAIFYFFSLFSFFKWIYGAMQSTNNINTVWIYCY